MSVDEITLQGAVADCYRGSPLVNSTGSVNAIDITGQAAPAGAARTRIYIRNQGDAWASSDQRLKLNGVDEWDPATVTYPLIYTGATGELTAGYPPTVTQVKAIRPIDLSTEAIGAITGANLPPEAVTEIELARSVGTVLLGGLEVQQSEAVNMTVTVTAGEAIMLGRPGLLHEPHHPRHSRPPTSTTTASTSSVSPAPACSKGRPRTRPSRAPLPARRSRLRLRRVT